MAFRIPVSHLATLQPRRIALIKPSALGDVVQTLPLLPALRQRFAEARISWVIRRDLVDLLAEHPELSETIPFERRGTWRSWFRLLVDLRRRRFDLVLDLQGLARSAAMTLATAAPVRVGLETAREGAHLACHVTVPGTGGTTPAAGRWRTVAAALGARQPPERSGLVIPAAARQWAAERLSNLPRPILAIHAGAGWETKRWPAGKFAEIARRYPGSIVTVGSRLEAGLSAPIAAATIRSGRISLDLCGGTTLPQLAAVLESVDLLLSNDSGPMHLAAAAGTTVVGIFTCTSPQISGPAGPGHVLVAAEVHCAGSYCKHCPQPRLQRLACLDELSVERVWRGVELAGARRTATRRTA